MTQHQELEFGNEVSATSSLHIAVQRISPRTTTRGHDLLHTFVEVMLVGPGLQAPGNFSESFQTVEETRAGSSFLIPELHHRLFVGFLSAWDRQEVCCLPFAQRTPQVVGNRIDPFVRDELTRVLRRNRRIIRQPYVKILSFSIVGFDSIVELCTS